jgi:hypothetical protein
MTRTEQTRRQLEDEVRRDIADLVGRALSNDKVAMRVLRAMIAEVPAVLPIIFRQLPSRAQPVTRVASQG